MVDDVSVLTQDGRNPAVAVPTLVVMIDGFDRLLDLSVLVLEPEQGKMIIERASLKFRGF